MANICFTVLHYRVPFVYALSVELERRGHSVFFLCPSLSGVTGCWLKDK